MAKKKKFEIPGAKLAPYQKRLTKDQKSAAKALGINKVNKVSELDRINNYVSAAQNSKSDPVYQQAAKNLGITNYNSVNDYAQVVRRMAGGPAPSAPSAPAAATNSPASSGGYSPKPLDVSGMGGGTPTMDVKMPDIPPPQMTVGGPGSSVDAGATGFRRKRSSARLAGLTSKGPSQFKITGQSAKSSGLNIGR